MKILSANSRHRSHLKHTSQWRVVNVKANFSRYRHGAIPRSKGKRSPKKTKTCDMSRVRRDHPRCRSATWICMSGHTRDLVIYSRFHRNLFRCFGATGGRSLAFPITLAIGFYSSLYYHTIKDWAASICIILNAAYCYRSSVVCVCLCLLSKMGTARVHATMAVKMATFSCVPKLPSVDSHW